MDYREFENLIEQSSNIFVLATTGPADISALVAIRDTNTASTKMKFGGVTIQGQKFEER